MARQVEPPSNPVNLPDEITTAIVEAPDADPRRIAADLTARFGRTVPVTVVTKVRGSLARASNVNRAREAASSNLTGNLDIMTHAKNKLLAAFDDEAIPLKDRLEVSKELRQWTKMEVDTAGIEDAETGTVFVISSDWSAQESE